MDKIFLILLFIVPAFEAGPTTATIPTTKPSPSTTATVSTSSSKPIDDKGDGYDNETMSYDAEIYQDYQNATGEIDFVPINGTNVIDEELYYRYNVTSSNGTDAECQEWLNFKWMHHASRTTIILTILFVTSAIVVIGWTTYRNIVKLIP